MKKQIQILTIHASLMWPKNKIKGALNVSDYSIWQAKNLLKKKVF